MGPLPSEARTALDLWRAKREGTAGLMRRQESRLAALVASARANSRFYRRLYRGTPCDEVLLEELPPVTKPELMAAFDDWVTDPVLTRAALEEHIADPALVGVPYRGEYFVCTSSGTTGHPGLFVYDQNAITVMRAMMVARADVGWLDVRDWLRLTARQFRWAAAVGAGGHFAGAGWVELERRRGRWRARSYRVFPVEQPIRQLASALESFDPAILTVYPSALELLAEEQSAGRLRLRPVFIETAGETVTADARAEAAAVFGCPVHDAYAASECQWMATDCPEDWLHVNCDWTILEPVDEDRRPTPPGEASHTVLLTNLANRVQPIIRYDLGDSVLARPDPCPCGSPLPAIRVVGRRDDVLSLAGADGTAVSILPLAIGSVVEETPGVHRCQILQTGPAAIRLRLEPRAGADAEQVWRTADANLRAFLAQQGLGNVGVVRDSRPVELSGAGKFHQVIARVTTSG